MVAFLFQQYATWCGSGFTHDSYQYLAAAESFGKNHTLLNAAGEPYTVFSPLFPIILSFFGDSVVSVVSLFHGLLLAGTLFLFHSIGRKMIARRRVRFLYLASISLGTPMLLIHSFFWSEPLFLFILGVKGLLLMRALDSGKFRFIFLLGLFGLFLCLQRNAGVFFVGGITMSLLLLGRDHHRKLYSLYYLLVSVSGFALWNYYAAQAGGRNVTDHPFFTGYFGNILHYMDTIGKWFVPLPDPVITLILLPALVFICCWILLRTVGNIPSGVLRYVRAFFITGFVYLSAMFVLTGQYPYESERLLAVIYPVVMLLVFFVVDRAAQIPFVKKYYSLMMIAGAVWLLYPVSRTIKNIHQWHRVGCQTEETAKETLIRNQADIADGNADPDANSKGHIFLSPQKK